MKLLYSEVVLKGLRFTQVSLLICLITVFYACGSHEITESVAGALQIDEVSGELDHPWGFEFLPDGRILVTERSGALKILRVDSTLSDPLVGLPEVFNKGQGGLLDVAIDPQFGENNRVYLTFAEPGDDGTASVAFGYGILTENGLNDFQVIFRQSPKVDSGHHFGSRIVFSDGHIFITLGDRGKLDPAQDLSNHIGTVIRLKMDGSVPDDNPFVNHENAQPEIWSYGHRNIQAAAIEPGSGLLWVAEMGPQGGDELNLVQKGNNYGWPEVSWGEDYDGTAIPDPPTRAEFADAVFYWTPVISPSGMDFYTGDMFPNWKGKMLIGGLTNGELVIVKTDGMQAQELERVDIGSRVRDVKQAPDGSIYIITDQSNGKILRLHN